MDPVSSNQESDKQDSPIWLQAVLGAILSLILLVVTGVISPLDWFGGIGDDGTVQASVLILQDDGASFDGSSCTGVGDLAPVHSGAQIILFQGDAIVTASLGNGTRTPEGNCRFSFEVDGVSAGRVRAQIGTLSTSGNINEHPDDGRLWVTFDFGL